MHLNIVWRCTKISIKTIKTLIYLHPDSVFPGIGATRDKVKAGFVMTLPRLSRPSVAGSSSEKQQGVNTSSEKSELETDQTLDEGKCKWLHDVRTIPFIFYELAVPLSCI